MHRNHLLAGLIFAAATAALAADPAALPGKPTPYSATARKDAAAPPRLVTFFTGRSECPEGWESVPAANGRLIVATTAGGNVGVTVGTPMRNRTPPTHQHTANFSVSLTSKSVSAANGGSNTNGAANGTRRGSATWMPSRAFSQEWLTLVEKPGPIAVWRP